MEEENGRGKIMPSNDGYSGKELEFNTYEDHRMAMAFAPLATKATVTIEEPEVVNKSYPQFWKDLATAGIATELLG